jgi:intein/homing endonuclease
MGLACKFRARRSSNCFDVFAGSDWKHNNVLRKKLKDLGLWGLLGHQKFIPDAYKLGSKNVRFAMLAGLIDADGNLSIHNSVSYCTTSKRLAEDVAFIARSLGFGASLRKPQIWLKQNWRPIYTVCIFGDFSQVPLLVNRKIPNPRKSPKNVLRTGCSVRKLDRQMSYRKLIFEGNDQHYLKSDFMVMKGGDTYVV